MQQSKHTKSKNQKTLENQQKPTFHTIASGLPKKDRNEASKQQAQQREKQMQNARTKRKSEEERLLSRHKNHRQEKTLGFFTQKIKGERTRKKKQITFRKNAVGKKQQKAQYAIYRGTAPRKAKRQTTPSLKRHAA